MPLVLHAVNLNLHIGQRLQTVGQRHLVAHELHLVLGHIVLQHVAHDEGKIVKRHYLLAVAQFGDALRHTLCLLGCQLQAQFLQVTRYVGPTAGLAHSILALASEAFGHQRIVIETALVIAIGVNTGHLRKHIVADDGLVGGNADATVALHQTTDVVELVLADAGLGIKLVLQNHLHARQRGIATTLAQTVHRDMQAAYTTQRSRQRVGHGKVVVVMGMEVEVGIGIMLHHLAEVLNDLQGIHNAQRVGQHETAYVLVDEGIHQLIDVLTGVLHPARPVL